MARVTAYEASDGSLHRDKKEWIRHESNLLVAQKLRPLIAEQLEIDDASEHQETVDELHDFIVKGIGLNTLRELFALQFKPGADDNEPGNAGQASEGGADSSEAAKAPAATEDAASADI